MVKPLLIQKICFAISFLTAMHYVAYAQNTIGGGDKPKNQEFIKASQIAQAELPGAQLIMSRVEKKGCYGFYFLVNGRIFEIEINEKKFNIDKAKEVDEIPSDDLNTPEALQQVVQAFTMLPTVKGVAKLPSHFYFEKAIKASKVDGPQQVTMTVKDGKLVLIVQTDSGKITIDATTGAIVK